MRYKKKKQVENVPLTKGNLNYIYFESWYHLW